MVQVVQLTPETLISAPRRGPAVPNRGGTLALFSETTHSFDIGTTTELRVFNIGKGSSIGVTDEDGIHDAQWVPGTSSTIIYLKAGDRGITQAVVADGEDVHRERYVAATFKAPVANLKLKQLRGGGVAFVVTALIGPDGGLYNEEAVKKTSTARVFDTPAVRIWNEYYRERRYTLWYNELRLQNERWGLAGGLLKLLDIPDVEIPRGMYGVSNPGTSFDICDIGIVAVGRDLLAPTPVEVPATIQLFVPLESFTEPPRNEAKRMIMAESQGPGMATNIRINDDATTVAFMYTPIRDLYNRSVLFAPMNTLEATAVLSAQSGREPPTAFEFADGNSLIVQSERQGRSELEYIGKTNQARSHAFYKGSIVSEFHPLKSGRWDELVVCSSSFIASSTWQLVGTQASHARSLMTTARNDGRRFGLHEGMVREIWYTGSEGVKVHAFMICPRDFSESKRHPFIVRPHGGPISSWSDSWDVGTNFAVWAEQGYIVVLPNISGSTGYGLDFARRINDSWAGRPFEDLKLLMEHLAQMPFLDQSKAVLMGASYGGYLISWAMGEAFIKEFCCAVWQCGTFNVPSFVMQSDILLDDNSFGTSPYPWEDMAGLERYNPAQASRLRNWKHAPPTLVIHGDKDYRVPVTEGLAAFHTLQAQGVKSRLLTFSDEAHFIEDPDNLLQWYRVVRDWMAEHVRDI